MAGTDNNRREARGSLNHEGCVCEAPDSAHVWQGGRLLCPIEDAAQDAPAAPIEASGAIEDAAAHIAALVGDSSVTACEAHAVIDWARDWALSCDWEDADREAIEAMPIGALLRSAHRALDGGLRVALDDCRRLALDTVPLAAWQDRRERQATAAPAPIEDAAPEWIYTDSREDALAAYRREGSASRLVWRPTIEAQDTAATEDAKLERIGAMVLDYREACAGAYSADAREYCEASYDRLREAIEALCETTRANLPTATLRLVGIEDAPAAPAPLGILAYPIEELELGVRAYNIAKRRGIDTCGALLAVTLGDMQDWARDGMPLGLPAARQIFDAQATIRAMVANHSRALDAAPTIAQVCADGRHPADCPHSGREAWQVVTDRENLPTARGARYTAIYRESGANASASIYEQSVTAPTIAAALDIAACEAGARGLRVVAIAQGAPAGLGAAIIAAQVADSSQGANHA